MATSLLNSNITLSRDDVSHIVIATLIVTTHFSGITEDTKFLEDLGRDQQGVIALYKPIDDAFIGLGYYLTCGPQSFGALKTVKDMVDLVFKSLKVPIKGITAAADKAKGGK